MPKRTKPEATDFNSPTTEFSGSSCHQIAGNMLLPDSAHTNETSLVVSRKQSAATPKSPQKAKHSLGMVYMNAGYGFITSKMFFSADFTRNPRQSMVIDAGINFVSRSGFGGGLRYSD